MSELSIYGNKYRQSLSGTWSLESVAHAEGRVVWDENGNPRYEYALRDQLGNAHILFSDLDGDGKLTLFDDPSTEAEEVVEAYQESHYYPFGMLMEGPFAPTLDIPDNYLYNTKEFNTDFGLDWYDYGARWHDPAIGRWGAVDPLAEKYIAISPYTYVSNNPIFYIDLDGMKIGDGKEIYEAFKKEAEDKVERLKMITSQLRIAASLARSEGKRGKARGLERQLNYRKEDLDLAKEVLSGLSDLYNSDVTYNYYLNCGNEIADDAGGETSYNLEMHEIDIQIRGGYSVGSIAHESAHAVQYQNGKISFDESGKRGGALYDLVDEYEAMQWAYLFNPLGLYSYSSVYDLQLRGNYGSVSQITHSIKLDSPVASGRPTWKGGQSYRSQMGIQLAADFKKGSKPRHYFIGWEDFYK